MSVSTYLNNCGYSLLKLKNEVHLVSHEAVNDMSIDGEDVKVIYNEDDHIGIRCASVRLDENTSIDTRYQFEHSVTFTVNGYGEMSDLDGLYYVIVITEDDTPFIVNPFFPCKVTYTYTLSDETNSTEFTLSTVSNLPVMRLDDFPERVSWECSGFSNVKVKHLLMNEAEYCAFDGSGISYTNEGFKTVKPFNKSITIQESFDGRNATQSVSFSIPFKNYKTYWEYKLLEFMQNRYSVVAVTNDGDWLLAGFGHEGLSPSYTIEADESVNSDVVNITLSNVLDSDNHLVCVEGGLITPLTDTHWEYTTAYNGYVCVAQNKAMYILMEEQDAIGNPTGNYKVKSGYEAYVPSDLNIVGTFTDSVYFPTSECKPIECNFNSNIPPTVRFNATGQRRYTVGATGDWSISSNHTGITVSPVSGGSGITTVTVANTIENPVSDVNAVITLTGCESSKTYNVVVSRSSSCWPGSTAISVDGASHNMQFNTDCCVSNWSLLEGDIREFNASNGVVSFFVPENWTGADRTHRFKLILCDSSEIIITVQQTRAWMRWVTEGQICNGNEKCDYQRMYTGVTSGSITSATSSIQTVNCSASTDCGSIITHWVTSQDTICVGNELHLVEYEEMSTDGGETWERTGNSRPGAQIIDSQGICSDPSALEYRWVLTDEEGCATT